MVQFLTYIRGETHMYGIGRAAFLAIMPESSPSLELRAAQRSLARAQESGDTDAAMAAGRLLEDAEQADFQRWWAGLSASQRAALARAAGVPEGTGYEALTTYGRCMSE